jgi:hypothetical protein
MQYLIQLKHKKEELLLLALLERLKISYQVIAEKPEKQTDTISFVDRFAGKLPMLRQIEQLRNEWD